jgi:hypothetical protein
MNNIEVYGAVASVRILFDGNLRTLAERLRVALNLSSVNVEPSEYPPYSEVGSAEALGWELWLKSTQSGCYVLFLETEHALAEVSEGRLHDLSAWLARYLAMMCDLNVVPAPADWARSV